MDFGPLETYAELSIGLIGFAGVVSALGKSRLNAEIRAFRVISLLRYSATSLFGSLFPVVLGSYDFNENTVWFVSTLGLSLAFVAVIIWGYWFNIAIMKSERFLWILARIIRVVLIAVLAYLMYGLVFSPHTLDAIYLVGLSTMLGLGVFHFCMLVASIQFE